MSNLGWAEMFYRLFRASWLPGQDVIWRVAQNLGTTAAPNWQRYVDLPLDGIIMNFIVCIFAVLLVDWILKNVRRR